jgi:pyruvate,water dikinase
MVMVRDLIVWFKDVSKEDVPLVGGKGANLGEMVRAGIPVPPGFILTAKSYDLFLKESGLAEEIAEGLADLDFDDSEKLHRAAKKIQQKILKAPVPKAIREKALKAYRRLDPGGTYVAVRSSATAEDLPDASFAGQQATFLNVRGEKELLEAINKCWASLFTPRAIFYRGEKGFDQLAVKIAVPVQKMVQSETSGVMFTIDPVTEDKWTLVIEAIWGLGELIVQGSVTPDTYRLKKKSLKIVEKKIGTQKIQLIKKGKKTKEMPVAKKWQSVQKISDEKIIALAKIGLELEKHYYFPQDIEWAIEGGKIFIVQTRPVTTLGKAQEAKKVTEKRKPILEGTSASPGRVAGEVKVIHGSGELAKVKSGDVLVAEKTTPDYVPGMRRAVAIVTDRGGETSHAAIVSRELGIPCVVGTGTATTTLKSGEVVTVDGTLGKIYRGGLPKGEEVVLQPPYRGSLPKGKQALTKTATKIYVNLAQPELADRVAARNVDGVGLLRAEFMIAEQGVHPHLLLQEKKTETFVKTLTDGISQFCRSFNPRPVVYRATDFKTNEYRQLKGGEAFEPVEENPFMGYRGAYRYLADPEIFRLEIEAIKRVKELGYANLYLMLPFVRTVAELKEVKSILAKNGLTRRGNFQLWMMVEIPANVILLDKFLGVGIDGISIGSNDLTMLLLGVDRDNEILAERFNEQDPSVLWALRRVVTTCRKMGVTSSICGQAPSRYPDLVERLVEWGITSISVNPDAIESVREVVARTEERLGKRRG